MDAILVADVTGKEVVFSTPCFKAGYLHSDGTQILVEISNLQLLAYSADKHDIIKYVDASIDIAKGCLAIGSFIFPEAALVLSGLIAVGSAVQWILGKIPDDKPDPVAEKMKELQKIIYDVEKKMNAQFECLKAFISESEFTVDIVTETAILMSLMRSCMKNPTEEAVKSFKDAYECNSPLKLVYIMTSFLEQKSTNPVLMAMSQDESEELFNTWENIIKGLLGEFLFIEGFATGLFKDGNPYEWDRIMEQSQEVFNALKDWRKDFGFKENIAENFEEACQNYWDKMKEYLDNFEDNHGQLSNAQKADEIKKELEKYSTSDSFYVIVSDSTSDKEHFELNKFVDDEQFLEYESETVKIIIYRSRYANIAELEELEKVKWDVRAVKTMADKKDMKKVRNMIENPLPNAGFSMLIGDLHEEIRSVNCPRRKDGPGWWTINWDFGGKIKQKLIVGFH